MRFCSGRFLERQRRASCVCSKRPRPGPRRRCSPSPVTDELTGVRLRILHPIDDQIDHLCRRLRNWDSLRTTANADKKIGIIFYNHPPGRHNIGADNLDVVDSLFDLLHEMKHRGYTVGELPESPEQLLDWLQTRAVNLPEDREALSAMSERVVTIGSALESLPFHAGTSSY